MEPLTAIVDKEGRKAQRGQQKAARPGWRTKLTDQERVLQDHAKGMRKALKREDYETFDKLKHGYELMLDSYVGRFKSHYEQKRQELVKEEKWSLGYGLRTHSF